MGVDVQIVGGGDIDDAKRLKIEVELLLMFGFFEIEFGGKIEKIVGI